MSLGRSDPTVHGPLPRGVVLESPRPAETSGRTHQPKRPQAPGERWSRAQRRPTSCPQRGPAGQSRIWLAGSRDPLCVHIFPTLLLKPPEWYF